jgi:hypothetical protein
MTNEDERLLQARLKVYLPQLEYCYESGSLLVIECEEVNHMNVRLSYTAVRLAITHESTRVYSTPTWPTPYMSMFLTNDGRVSYTLRDTKNGHSVSLIELSELHAG